MEQDVFISYSRQDADVAVKLRSLLEQKGITCWQDTSGISGGGDWSEEIGTALQSVKAVVLLFSSNCMDSENVKDEIVVAAKRRLIIIPVRIEDVEPKVGFWELRLSRFNWVDAFDEMEERIERLAEDIKKRLDSIRTLQEGERTETGSRDTTQKLRNEARLVNAMKVACKDGGISHSERDTINAIAMQEGISPERLEELENQFIRQLGTPSGKAESKADRKIEVAWPDCGLIFLQNLKRGISTKLPFEPEGISEEDEEEENMGIWWYASEKHHYSAWLYGKKTPNVTLAYGFYSDNEKRDPLFRTIADDLQSKGVVPDAEDDDTEEGGCFFLPEGELGVYAEKRIRIDELASPALLEETSACFSDFITKTWPVISPHYVK
jgi:hypothetical protein